MPQLGPGTLARLPIWVVVPALMFADTAPVPPTPTTTAALTATAATRLLKIDLGLEPPAPVPARGRFSWFITASPYLVIPMSDLSEPEIKGTLNG
jgi:hypothetical protein